MKKIKVKAEICFSVPNDFKQEDLDNAVLSAGWIEMGWGEDPTDLDTSAPATSYRLTGEMTQATE